ncbi:hypothetical protein LTR36_009111 [Oleoguttula mirabilis]|uniref:Uncharacterized protein n=1 Tax=Oleoguttula mirabilis TaxID=1507867 RepID=A0AAV9J863_9PEZI|nr:hypothetical protein LTR36_009111 [Oleoguttula mirabilis]
MAAFRHHQQFASFAEQDAVAQKAVDDAIAALQANMVAISLRNDRTSRLLKLPAELRNHIYRYAVVSQAPIQLHLGVRRLGRDPSTLTAKYLSQLPRIFNPEPPRLATVCHKLYREVKPIYLAENTFCLTTFTTTERIHGAHAQHFRRLLGDVAKDVRQVKVCRRVATHTGLGTLYNRFTAAL